MKLWWKRYEHILEAKPRAAEEVIAEMMAAEAAEMCAHFPPDAGAVDWVDASLQRRIAGRLDELPTPGIALVEVVAKLVAWDLEHEIDAIDHFIRNDEHRVACPTVDDETAMHFLWRGILELFAARKEEAQGRLKRAHLVTAAQAIPAAFSKARAQQN